MFVTGLIFQAFIKNSISDQGDVHIFTVWFDRDYFTGITIELIELLIMVFFDVSKVAWLLPKQHVTAWLVTQVWLLSCVFVLMLDHVYFLRELLRTISALKSFDLEMTCVKMSPQSIASLIMFFASFEWAIELDSSALADGLWLRFLFVLTRKRDRFFRRFSRLLNMLPTSAFFIFDLLCATIIILKVKFRKTMVMNLWVSILLLRVIHIMINMLREGCAAILRSLKRADSGDHFRALFLWGAGFCHRLVKNYYNELHQDLISNQGQMQRLIVIQFLIS